MNFKIRLLQLLNHLVLGYGLWYLYASYEYQWLLVSLISYFIIGVISVVITLHRLLAHRSFKTYQWLENLLSLVSVYSTLGPTIAWVGLHRYHHTTADTQLDPHSPHNGVIKAWTGYGWKVNNIPLKYTKDLYQSKFHRWIFKNYFKIIILTMICVSLVDPLFVVFGYCLPSVITLHGTSVVNIFGHTHGYRSYDTKDKSTNSWIANLMSFGDGWHNNHHNNPANYRAGEKWSEWDICAKIIEIIRIT